MKLDEFKALIENQRKEQAKANAEKTAKIAKATIGGK